ncbi:MAG: hypothetical protein V4484_07150 [Pseudomonadota bacterium]
MKTALITFFVLACATTSSQAASFDCVVPVFPDHSRSNDGVRRIEKEITLWRACNAAHRGQARTLEVDRLKADVELNLARWIASTRIYSGRQQQVLHALNQIERDKASTGNF